MSTGHQAPTTSKQSRAAYLLKRRLAVKIEQTAEHGPRPKIEKGVPLPPELRGGARQFSSFYPFQDMEIGDSFWVPGGTTCTNGAATAFAAKSGWGFKCRGETRDGRPLSAGSGHQRDIGKPQERGTRVWRVK